jgi:hypothetical protein
MTSPTSPTAQNPDHHQQVIAAYTRGQTITACAATFYHSATTIRRILIAHDIPRRPPGQRPLSPGPDIITASTADVIHA